MKKRNEIIAVSVSLLAIGILFFWGGGFMNVGNKAGNNNINNKMENKNDAGVPDGISSSSGAVAKSGDEVSIHYTGMLENGVKFDSSVDRGQPFEFMLGSGQVIKGFDKGITGMKVGEKKRIVIKPEDGYGDRQVGSIPPNSTLVFDVELLGINSGVSERQ